MRARLTGGLLGIASAALVFGLLGGPASADPNGAKNAFSGTADCGSAGSFDFVVNSANGQGSGTNNNGNQAEWTPAHLSPGNGVFHPTVFDLTFTFTPAGGTPMTETDTSARKNQTGNVTCNISGSQMDEAGDTFMLSGTVTGWIS
jgi:hypothetical protein